MSSTKIEWTEETWNPQTGCLPDLPCYKRCYARRMARRLQGRYGYPPAPDYFKPTFHPDKLAVPLKWKQPRSCFINSMGDIALGTPEQIAAQLGVVAACPDSRFQLLTKRPALLLEWFNGSEGCPPWSSPAGAGALRHHHPVVRDQCKHSPSRQPWPLPNLAIGVSVSTQADADERVPLLLRIPAACRFVSQEPALESICYTKNLPNERMLRWYRPMVGMLDGIIIGGETGPGARPMHPDVARSTRDQCEAAGVPFFLKAMGSAWPGNRERDEKGRFVGKKYAGRLLDGRTHDELPWTD